MDDGISYVVYRNEMLMKVKVREKKYLMCSAHFLDILSFSEEVYQFNERL